MFAIFSAIVLRPLPYAHEEELVRLRVVYSAADTPNGSSLSYPYYEDIKHLDAIFSSVSTWVDATMTVTGTGEARHTVRTPPSRPSSSTRSKRARSWAGRSAPPGPRS